MHLSYPCVDRELGGLENQIWLPEAEVLQHISINVLYNRSTAMATRAGKYRKILGTIWF